MPFKRIFPSVFTFLIFCGGALTPIARGDVLTTAPPSDHPVAITAAPVPTPTPTATISSDKNPFQSGLAAFQKGDYAQARASFTASLQIDPDSPSALYNLGLSEQKLGHIGMALALWRKALATSPGDVPSTRAIRWTKDKLEHPEIPHDVELWESLRSNVLVAHSIHFFLLITAVAFVLAGLMVIRFLSGQRRARLDETPMPRLSDSGPLLGLFSLLVFVLGTTLTAAKAYDETIPRGTILIKRIEARSAPGETGTPLFDLFEGLEVIVRQQAQGKDPSNGWVQVSYPGGSTGWISQSSILSVNDSITRSNADKAAP